MDEGIMEERLDWGKFLSDAIDANDFTYRTLKQKGWFNEIPAASRRLDELVIEEESCWGDNGSD